MRAGELHFISRILLIFAELQIFAEHWSMLVLGWLPAAITCGQMSCLKNNLVVWLATDTGGCGAVPQSRLCSSSHHMRPGELQQLMQGGERAGLLL
jgi:hypothetical protein